MNKKLLIGLVVVAALALGGGAYYFGNKNGETVVVTSNNSQLQNQQNNAKQLDLEAILAATKNKFPTVKETKVYNEQNDPNKVIGKPGYYVAGAVFWDTRTNYETPPDDPNAWGSDAGGGIEVYSTESDAAKRANYLKGFQGNPITEPGAFKQVGKSVIRVSSSLTKSQQDEIIEFLSSQVQ